MPRKTHKEPAQERVQESIRERVELILPQRMRSFLEVEAKKLSEERHRTITEADIIRALIAAYYEKRMANLLVGPDD